MLCRLEDNIHLKRLIEEQICHNLIFFEGEAKQSKIKSQRWSKCISMLITKTASRNIAFKAAKMTEAVFETQADFVTTEVGGQVFSSELESLNDVECNADLHISHHEVVQN